MPFPSLLKRRPRLPIGGQLPLGEMSDMPPMVAPSRPEPIPLPRQEWHPPMVAPEPEPMAAGWHPPMARPQPEVARTPSFVPAQTSDARPSLELQRPQRAPMPDIPIVGGGGVTVPDNPYDRAERDYVMEGAKRNPDGSLAGDKLRFKRSGKDIALAALAGLGRGGVLGAATGALAATIDPKTGREMNFEAFHGPQIQAAMERGQQGMERQRTLQDIAMQRGELGLEQDQAETEMLRQKVGDFPEEMKSIRDERAWRAKEREANIKGLLNPVPRARNVYIDGEGLQRDRDTNEIMRDPTTGQKIYGKVDASPFSSSGLGIFDTRSGRVTTPAPERESPEDRYDRAEDRRQNTAADREIVQNNTLKSKAAELDAELFARESELAKIKKDDNPDEWEKANNAVTVASTQYAGAKQAMEEHAKNAAIMFPGLIEGGSGGKDRRGQPWAFLKKKDGMQRPSGGGQTGRRGTVGESHILDVMAAKSKEFGYPVTREEAVKMLRDKGYQVP